MSITSYSTLKTTVADWLKRTDLTASIPDFIRFAELRIYREMRVRQMEAALSGTIASGVLAVPSGYAELKYMRVGGQRVERKDVEWMYEKYPTRTSGGQPKFVAREVDSFIFGPYPDSAYTVTGLYYKALPALSDSNTTNWLITDAPDLILFASLCEAAPYMMNDERIPVWGNKYVATKDRIQTQDANEEFSGSPLAVTAR